MPEEPLDVLSRRLERYVLDQHLRRPGLLLPTFLLLLFLSPPSSELDIERVPVQDVSMHPFGRLPRCFYGAESDETVPHTQPCPRMFWIGLCLQAGKRKAG